MIMSFTLSYSRAIRGTRRPLRFSDAYMPFDRRTHGGFCLCDAIKCLIQRAQIRFAFSTSNAPRIRRAQDRFAFSASNTAVIQRAQIRFALSTAY